MGRAGRTSRSMEWRDTGMILSVRPHGETAAIIDVLTEEHGRHAGMVPGGASRRKAPVLQPGNQVELEWRARLEEHLGSYRAELVKSRTAVLGDRRALAGMGALTALLGFALPERMALPPIYHASVALADELAVVDDGWFTEYARWEVLLLQELGYGLDLGSCAATGQVDDLIYVSPRSGRAVSRAAGAPYAQKLLPLPGFLRRRGAAELGDVLSALTMTGHFLERWLAPALGDRPLPAARSRLLGSLRRLDRADRGGGG